MKNPRRNLFFLYLGNFLIVASLVGIFYIYFPYISLFYFPKSLENVNVTSGAWLSISKINALSPIVKDVDPWNEGEYKKALKKGVAHAKGTSFPNEKGTSFLFAHSSDFPWNQTAYNTAFFRLSELAIHDEIIVHSEGKKLTYRVMSAKEVWPNEVEFMNRSEADLILQTCTPVGTSFKRLLVFAKKTT